MYTTRRHFLRNSAITAAGAGLISLPTLEAIASERKRVSASDKLRIGVIGLQWHGLVGPALALALERCRVRCLSRCRSECARQTRGRRGNHAAQTPAAFSRTIGRCWKIRTSMRLSLAPRPLALHGHDRRSVGRENTSIAKNRWPTASKSVI